MFNLVGADIIVHVVLLINCRQWCIANIVFCIYRGPWPPLTSEPWPLTYGPYGSGPPRRAGDPTLSTCSSPGYHKPFLPHRSTQHCVQGPQAENPSAQDPTKSVSPQVKSRTVEHTWDCVEEKSHGRFAKIIFPSIYCFFVFFLHFTSNMWQEHKMTENNWEIHKRIRLPKEVTVHSFTERGRREEDVKPPLERAFPVHLVYRPNK